MAGVGVSDGDNGGVSMEVGVGVISEVKVREICSNRFFTSYTCISINIYI